MNYMKGVEKILMLSIVFWGLNLSAQSKTSVLLDLDNFMKGRTNTVIDSTSKISFVRTQLYKPQKINDLPIFCKMEELIFKKSKMNLRINLGSNDYVRKLEGKL